VVKTASKTLSVYKTKPFARFAGKARITDADLWTAARLANQGMIGADLGGGVIKQRIARAGEGKSGGSRSIILFKKNDRANIGPDELEAFRRYAQVYLGYTNAELSQRVEDGALFRVEKPEGNDNA
jgi:hypothetical protein